MIKGYNKAQPLDKLFWVLEKEEVKNRSCVFLSHKKEDKDECRKIAEYFKDAGIDYYLDELDETLQKAAIMGDPSLITECIKKGIRESSHMLVVVSEKTYKSQWVPFEVGYGHAIIFDKSLNDTEKERVNLSILTLKDISEESLPDFMQVANIIRGTKSLNEYISKISGKIEKSLISEERLFSNSMMYHPLDGVLNWRL